MHITVGKTHCSTDQRSFMESARNLGVSAIYPLTGLSEMLLAWRQADLEDTTLSDSECDEEVDDNGEPMVKYATEKQYQAYVPPDLPFIGMPSSSPPRRMMRLEKHYSVLGIEAFFKCHPRLEV